MFRPTKPAATLLQFSAEPASVSTLPTPLWSTLTIFLPMHFLLRPLWERNDLPMLSAPLCGSLLQTRQFTSPIQSPRLIVPLPLPVRLPTAPCTVTTPASLEPLAQPVSTFAAP